MKLTLKLSLAFAASLILMFASALYGLHALTHSVTEYNTTVRDEVANERTISSVPVTFRLQLQEWKDTLLRGKNPDDPTKHWTALQTQERSVDDQIHALPEKRPQGESRLLVEQFAAAHVAMGAGYRKSFDAFQTAGFEPSAGDHAVVGVDREPARLPEEAAHKIAAESA